MPWIVGSERGREHQTRLVRYRLLGSDAVYRIGRRSGPVVEVEVVAAPSLASGTRLRLTSASLRAMARPVTRRRTAPLRARVIAVLERAAHLPLRPPAA